ncbi:MAG: biotin--[acetyl-CoA-carboxylase] ligase [Gemmatimonadaceae bacterium]|nr:biotin--[acetyl-CoA-carboxylase] ligase [Gemmatimonadaceae bacterium]
MRVMRGRAMHAPDDEQLQSASALGLVQLVHEREVASTMDVAHALAADGAPAGLLVVADRQHQGRGRGGNRWESRDGAGLWMTLIERPVDQRVIGVLALRLGLAIADALDPLVEDRIQLKWPNDVMTGRGKVAGILVEARWRNASVDWVAVGIGINRRVPPEIKSAAAVREGVSRARLLEAVVPRLRAAVSVQGQLSDNELAAWHARDFARGRRIAAPRAGRVVGIAADGALLVADATGAAVEAVHAGSLVFDEGA